MVVLLVFLMWAGSAASTSSSDRSEESTTPSSRQSKALSFYGPYLDDPQVNFTLRSSFSKWKNGFFHSPAGPEHGNRLRNARFESCRRLFFVIAYILLIYTFIPTILAVVRIQAMEFENYYRLI
ncbi:unnamed protein product [Nesidiocoris tenuis]|uniref:Uncharacterized protein n=1 Tax=Nesidiocoris tenuis TaxID=355587 RepID=A0A6H5GAT8_9HEMI|nr:unnamed protein product [Nesidiocoris tenuis]